MKPILNPEKHRVTAVKPGTHMRTNKISRLFKSSYANQKIKVLGWSLYPIFYPATKIVSFKNKTFLNNNSCVKIVSKPINEINNYYKKGYSSSKEVLFERFKKSL